MASVLSVAAVVSTDAVPRRAAGRQRVIGALLTIGSATTTPQRYGLPRWSSAPTHDDTPSDALLAQAEEALTDELERSAAAGLPTASLRLLHARLLDVRAARERLHLAAAVARTEAPNDAPAGGTPGATMAGVPMRRWAQALRLASPGVLGLLVNAVA